MKYILICLLSVCFGIYVNAQTTETLYLSGYGSDDAVEWDFFCTKKKSLPAT